MVFIHLPVRSSLNMEKPNAFGFEQNDGMNKVTKVVMMYFWICKLLEYSVYK